jgi:hypothetical protein
MAALLGKSRTKWRPSQVSQGKIGGPAQQLSAALIKIHDLMYVKDVICAAIIG